MEKVIYEKPELVELDSIFTYHGDSSCTDGISDNLGEGYGDACPDGADDEDP